MIVLTFNDLAEALATACALARRHHKRAIITVSYVDSIITVEVVHDEED